LVAVGMITVGMGAVGGFVPFLQTTPFLLLSATGFILSSSRLYDGLIHHRWFDRDIRNYREHKAITPTANLVWLRKLLAVIAVGVTSCLLILKILAREMLREPRGSAAEETAFAQMLNDTPRT
jgi:hypothetical protein